MDSGRLQGNRLSTGKREHFSSFFQKQVFLETRSAQKVR
jgi:hypothetical protein